MSCKPGVAGLIPGFSIKQLSVEPSGVPFIKYTHNHKPSLPSTGYYPWKSHKKFFFEYLPSAQSVQVTALNLLQTYLNYKVGTKTSFNFHKSQALNKQLIFQDYSNCTSFIFLDLPVSTTSRDPNLEPKTHWHREPSRSNQNATRPKITSLFHLGLVYMVSTDQTGVTSQPSYRPTTD